MVAGVEGLYSCRQLHALGGGQSTQSGRMGGANWASSFDVQTKTASLLQATAGQGRKVIRMSSWIFLGSSRYLASPESGIRHAVIQIDKSKDA